MSIPSLELLFTPLKLRNTTIRNRILMTGAQTGMASGGRVTDQLAAYYGARARGGAGLLVTEITIVHPSGFIAEHAVRNWDDSVIPGLKLIADEVHSHGGVVFGQIGHGGRQGVSLLSERPLLSASDLPSPAHGEVPKEAEVEDIAELVHSYAAAAVRVIAAGMDGVEIHSAYGGYLLAQWLSPTTNHRGDEYGGSFSNRSRIVLEVSSAVRNAIGDPYPVGIQITGKEGIPGGLTTADAIALARKLDQSGDLDYITVKAGTWAVKESIAPDMQQKHGIWVDDARAVRQAVNACRVFTVGRIVDPQHAERILRDGAADMVGMTRAQMADPDLANKARNGRFDEIRTCIGSNEGCQDSLYHGRPITCTLNPALGRERYWSDPPTPVPAGKRVLIVGGGPAGLKAAEVAAQRGHQVTLWEQDDQLGGQVRRFSQVSVRAEYRVAIEHLKRQLRALSVDVRTETEATAENVPAENFDTVVLGCGSLPGRDGFRHLRPDRQLIDGLEAEYVYDTWQALALPPSDPARMLVIDDGENGWKLLATAIHLAENGHAVAVTTPHASVGTGLGPMTVGPAMSRLFQLKIEPIPYFMLKRISRTEVSGVHAISRLAINLGPFDAVVTAFYSVANDSLYRALKGKVKELHRIGDCLAPRKVLDAVREGSSYARAI